MTLNWSKKPFIYGSIYGLIITLFNEFSPYVIFIPWGPLGVIGVAVAFYLGFKNNSSYDRTWEARKIWGAIVNHSRSFAASVHAFVQGEGATDIKRELIYRHLAWITALRHQLRLSRSWEHVEDRIRGLYVPNVCEDYHHKLNQELKPFLSEQDMSAIEGKSNKATQLLKIQSQRLQELRDQGYYEDFRHMELSRFIEMCYTDQGMCERIKNFPFPRQYASVALWITVIFSVFVPFGLFDVMEEKSLWKLISVPFLSGLLIWVFFLMEKIGDYSENPFEGTYNDVPITSISRAIEIDLREMLNDSDIPPPITDVNGFLM